MGLSYSRDLLGFHHTLAVHWDRKPWEVPYVTFPCGCSMVARADVLYLGVLWTGDPLNSRVLDVGGNQTPPVRPHLTLSLIHI